MKTETQQTEFSSLVKRVAREGEAQRQPTDETILLLDPADKLHSPLDVAGVDLPISTQEIIELIREEREHASLTVNSQCSEIT